MRKSVSPIRLRALLAAAALVATFGPASVHIAAAAPAHTAVTVTVADDTDTSATSNETDGIRPDSADVFVPGDKDDI
jgi:hypothetical protein